MKTRSAEHLDALLANVGWVRLLARQLCADAHAAEDAVQTTLAAALQHPPREAGSLRAYLARLLRNALLLDGRRAARRERRERAALATSEASSPAAGELVERAELQQRVVAAVLALPEKWRELVLQHWFEGETVGVIAMRTGRSPDAVRALLRRARDRLRRDLERRGDLHALSALAAPAGAGALMSAPIVVVGGIFMQGKLLVTAVALLAAVGLYFVAVDGSRSSKATPVDASESAFVTTSGAVGEQAAPAVAVVPPEAPIGSPERVAVSDTDAAPWIARGEVMHGSVAPLGGAAFVGRVHAGWQAVGDPIYQATLVSQADGTFEWALPAPEGPVTLSFAQARPDTTIMADTRTLVVGDEPPQDLRVVAFVKDCRVTGLVTDEAQRPIAGAWVKSTSRDEPQVCEADGSYHLTVSATYGDATVIAGASGYVLSNQTVSVQGPAAVATIDFELRPAVRLAGRVVDEQGAPVVGARVITFQTHAANVHTDADGHYAIAHLDPQRERHTVQVEHDDYLRLQHQVTPAELESGCDLVMKRGATIRGRVLGPDGRGVVGAHLHVGDWIGYLGAARAVSRDGGTFEAGNVPLGGAELRVYARGYAPAIQRVDIAEGQAESAPVEVHLEPGHFVAGRVVDADGNGLHRLRITPLGEGRLLQQLGQETYTARDGSFRLDDLPAGPIKLDCFGMDVARKQESGVMVDRTDVVIVMQRPAKLAGRVVDDATGQPLTRFTIRFVDPELHAGEQHGSGYGIEWSKGLVFDDADGHWQTDTERFDAGAVFGVEASAPGYGPVVQRRAIARVGAVPEDLVLRLRPAASIHGRVIDQRTGVGIEGAQLAVFDNAHSLAGRVPFEGKLACRTGADGAFELGGVPAGSVSIVVRHPDWPLTFDGPFEVLAGAVATRVVAVVAGATVTGTTLDERGQPVAGVVLARESVEIGGVQVPHASVTTDAQGRFRFDGLPTARYWLHGSGSHAGGSTFVYSLDVDVEAGAAVDLPLRPAGSAVLEIELTCDEALPSKLGVTILRADAKPGDRPFSATMPGTSVAGGTPFVVRGLPAGRVQVRVSHFDRAGIVHGNATIDLASGVTARVTLPVFVRKR